MVTVTYMLELGCGWSIARHSSEGQTKMASAVCVDKTTCLRSSVSCLPRTAGFVELLYPYNCLKKKGK